MRLVRALVVLGAVVGTGPAHAARVGFDDRTTKVPGQIFGVARGDLDGDALEDLVVLYRRGHGTDSRRFVGIIFRRPEGLPARPDLAFEAPPAAALFDLADMDGAPGDELVYLTGSGVYGHGFRGRQAAPVAKLLVAASLVGAPEPDDLPRWDFARPGPSGELVLLIPGRRDLRLFAKTEEGWSTRCKVAIQQQAFYSARGPDGQGSGGGPGGAFALRVTNTLPILDIVEATGDDRPDLVTHFEDVISVHPGDAEGCFSTRATSSQRFRMRTPEEERAGTASVIARLTDLDQDGIVDLALTKVAGGLTDLRTEIRLHRGEKGGRFSARPVQSFESSGYGAFARYEDIDGDGRVEMVQPRAEISILGLTRMLLSSSFTVKIDIRRRGGSGSEIFAERPVQTLETNFGLDFDAPNGLLGALPMFGHDWNGDGRPDVLLSKGKDQLGLHRGRAGKEPFESRHPWGLEGPGSVATQVLEPGADRLPEVLVWYPGRKGMDDTLKVYQPRGITPID